ncbi:MAG: hypothetical protein WCH76_06420 [Candidatus Riflemargulisbacteria bacterium]
MSKNLFLSPILAPVYEDIAFEFRDVTAGTAQTYILDMSASFPYTIVSVTLVVDTGTLTGVAIKIVSTAVTNMDSITITNSITTTSSTGAKAVALTNAVSLVTSTGYSGAPTLLRGKLKIVRT